MAGEISETSTEDRGTHREARGHSKGFGPEMLMDVTATMVEEAGDNMHGIYPKPGSELST